jgi:DNA-binding beta-propeller fold protein YncE
VLSRQQVGPVAASATRVFDAAGEVVGAGFVLGPRQVATCAHVVCAALGGSPEDPTAPTGRLRVDLPLLASPHTSDAVVRTWRPIDPVTGTGDVAVLELSTPPPSSARVPPLHKPDRLWGHRFRVLGFPAAMQDGLWTAGQLLDRQGTRWLQLQSDPHSPPVAQGFSGAPVWDEEVEAVVGMTVASDVRPDSTTAYLLPIEDVLGVDPRLLPNPYRGLEPFGEEHADVFYGREDEVARLEALLDRQPIVAVAGRSGTGKSSLVRAGLLPRLRRRGVHVVEFRPGPVDESPSTVLDRLSGTVAGLLADESNRGVLLFADQFEELVGIGPASEEPTPAQDVLHRLVDMVPGASGRPDGASSLRVVLTLRWEAMNEILTDDVAETFDRGTFSLAAMSRDQLRRAIVGPTARAPGLEFDPGLVERILDDAVAEPGQLPLVESLLAQLWAAREGGTLKSAAYEQLGGVKGAVARHAEHAVGQLAPVDDDAGHAVLRRLLTTLARPDDTGGFVRRAVRLEALPTDQQQVVERLARSRLLVVGQETDGDHGAHTVELAHQALIDHWPRLRSWLDEDGDFLLWQHEIDRQRQAWDKAGQDDGALLRGVALARAKEWTERRGNDVPPAARSFVEASRHREAREARRRRILRSAGGVVLALLLVLGATLVFQRREARREAAISASRNLATLATDTAGVDPALSMMQAVAAYERHPTSEAEQALFRLYVEYRGVDAVLSGAPGDIVDVEASHDGQVIAALTSLGRVAVWVRQPGQPVATRQIMPTVGGSEGVRRIGVSPDGEGILVVEPGRAWYYDVATGEPAWEVPIDNDVRAVELRDDGTAVLLMLTGPGVSYRLELWEPSGNGARRVADLTTREGVSAGLGGFGHAEHTVIFDEVDLDNTSGGGRRVQLWDTRTGELTTLATDVNDLVVSPDGTMLAACRQLSGGWSLTLVDLRDGTEQVFDLPQGATCYGPGTAIDPSNEVVVTADGQVLIDTRTGETSVQPLTYGGGQATPAIDAVWNDGDRHLALVYDSARLIVAELSTDDEFLVGMSREPAQPADFHRSVRLTPDGEHLVALLDGHRRIAVSPTTSRGVDFQVATSAVRPAPHWEPSVHDLAIDPRGTLVADRVAAELVQVRRLPSLELVSEIRTRPVAEHDIDHDDTATYLGFAGDELVTSDGTHLEWWDPATGELLREYDLPSELLGALDDPGADGAAVAPVPGSSQVAVVDEAGDEIAVLDAATGRVVETIPVGRDAGEALFQADSPYLALRRRGGFVEMWDVDRRRRVLGPLTVPESPEPGTYDPDLEPPEAVVLTQFAPEPGGLFVGIGATTSHGVQLRWYQAGSDAPERALEIGAPGEPLESGPQPLAVSADGNTAVLALRGSPSPPEPAPVLALDLRPEAWQEGLCQMIGGRRFTEDELATMPDGTASLTLC